MDLRATSLHDGLPPQLSHLYPMLATGVLSLIEIRIISATIWLPVTFGALIIMIIFFYYYYCNVTLVL